MSSDDEQTDAFFHFFNEEFMKWKKEFVKGVELADLWKFAETGDEKSSVMQRISLHAYACRLYKKEKDVSKAVSIHAKLYDPNVDVMQKNLTTFLKNNKQEI